MVEHHLGKRKLFRKHFGATGYALIWMMNVGQLAPRYLRLRLQRSLARRQGQPFGKSEQMRETAKLLRLYLGMPLGR